MNIVTRFTYCEVCPCQVDRRADAGEPARSRVHHCAKVIAAPCLLLQTGADSHADHHRERLRQAARDRRRRAPHVSCPVCRTCHEVTARDRRGDRRATRSSTTGTRSGRRSFARDRILVDVVAALQQIAANGVRLAHPGRAAGEVDLIPSFAVLGTPEHWHPELGRPPFALDVTAPASLPCGCPRLLRLLKDFSAA